MKTTIKTISTICAVVISLTVNAQHRSRGNEPQNNMPQNNNNNQQVTASNNNDRYGHHNNHHGNNYHNNWGGGISVQIGGNPWGYNNNNYGYANGYNNYNNIKRAARNSIRQSANVIGDALNYSNWNDTYSPWLAKAIRHQQYAKQLYFWGDYAGALNHAERAGYLAWNTLSYYNSNDYDEGYAGNNNFNPYSDPNNPYYRKNNETTQPTNNTNTDEDFGYKKPSTTTTQTEVNQNKENTKSPMAKEEIDTALPTNKLSDKELLKTSAKDLDIFE